MFRKHFLQKVLAMLLTVVRQRSADKTRHLVGNRTCRDDPYRRGGQIPQPNKSDKLVLFGKL